MSDFPSVRDLLEESVDELLTRHCPTSVVAAAEETGWSPELWDRLEAAEMTRVGIPTDRGGAGGGTEEAAAVVEAAARFAAPVPLAEALLLAAPLLAETGAPIPSGPLSAGTLVSGEATVPYGRFAAAVVLLDGEELLVLREGEYELNEGANLAGEPRDRVRPQRGAGERWRSPVDAAGLRRQGALARAVQIAGALQAVLDLAVTHASQRQQFGSPLNRFQAVQELLTVIAEETAAAEAAVRSAVAHPTPYQVAAAKARASEAAGLAAQSAHQVHGAIGFTQEHALQLSTRRLWSWRDEYGNEAAWQRVLGGLALAAGAGGLWPLITEEGRE